MWWPESEEGRRMNEYYNIIAGGEERENKMLRKTFAQLTHAPTHTYNLANLTMVNLDCFPLTRSIV